MSHLRQTHLDALAQWRKAMNLVGPGPLEDHFRDCHQGLGPLASMAVTGRWVDLGSGAGFPGLVLADLFPALHVDLVESRKKRVAFLRHVVGTAGVSDRVGIVDQRVEDLAGPYDGIVSRSFARPPVVVAHARRLLAPGGTLVWFLQEGPFPTDDGFELLWTHPYEVPQGQRQTTAWRLVG